MNGENEMKETTELFQFILGFGMAIDTASADGWDWSDSLKILPTFTKLPEAIKGYEKIPVEYKNYDDEQRLKLHEVIRQFDIRDDYIEKIAEQGLISASELVKFVIQLRSARK